MVQPARILNNYFEYSAASPLRCTECNWSGIAQDGVRDNHSDLFDVSCPKCEKMLLVVPYPTFDQIREAAQRDHPEAISMMPTIEKAELRRNEFDRSKLKSTDQLPELYGSELHFVWDSEDCGNDRFISIICNKKTIWCEPEWWECWQRFNEVKTLLRQKYGDRACTLTPTERSLLYLYGDASAHRANLSFHFEKGKAQSNTDATADLASQISGSTGVAVDMVRGIVTEALSHIHRLAMVGDKGATDAVLETRFSFGEDAAFHLIGFLATSASYKGDLDGARDWNEVAQRFIPDAYRKGVKRIEPWFDQRTPGRRIIDEGS